MALGTPSRGQNGAFGSLWDLLSPETNPKDLQMGTLFLHNLSKINPGCPKSSQGLPRYPEWTKKSPRVPKCHKCWTYSAIFQKTFGSTFLHLNFNHLSKLPELPQSKNNIEVRRCRICIHPNNDIWGTKTQALRIALTFGLAKLQNKTIRIASLWL